MIHPSTELRFVDPPIGLGVFATAPIPAGTLSWVLDDLDLRLSPEAFAQLSEAQRAYLDHYGYVDPDGHVILCWDAARFMNHSCEPNTRGFSRHADIVVRDIPAGAQLTCDYAELNLVRPLDCLCKSAGCRGRIGLAEPTERFAEFDRQVARAMVALPRLPQPLAEVAVERDAIALALRGAYERPSSTGYLLVPR